MRFGLLVAAAALVCAGQAGAAPLVPTITGTLTFGSPSGTNYFDPAQGYVPSGFGNSSGTTVAIQPGVEFGFDDGANRDTADFTGNTLTVTDVATGSGSLPFYMTFTSTDPGFFFQGSFINSSFEGGPDGVSFRVQGNTLTFFAPGYSVSGTRLATIAFGPPSVPEPATWAMMIVGFGVVGVCTRRYAKVRLKSKLKPVAAI